jgi:hypothetical protein
MHRLRHPKPLLVQLLVLAIGLRGLLVPGFMPGEGVLLELCTASGVQSMLVDPRTGEVLDDPHSAGPECPWSAVLTHAVLPGTSVGVAAPARSAAPIEAPGTSALLRLASGLPPVRAPPES